MCKKKILIAGYYGFKNTGDETILSSMLTNMRKHRDDLDFVVVSSNPIETEKRYQVKSVHYRDIPRTLLAVQESDLVLLGGGGLFQDYWGVEKDTMLTSASWDIPYYAGFGLLATLFNKPFMLYSVGVGPLYSDEGKELTRLVFSLADISTVRDQESQEETAALGIPREQVIVTADPALTFAHEKEKAKEILKKAGVTLEKKNIVGVSVRNWDIGCNQEEWRDSLAFALDSFIKEYSVQVVFIPFDTAEDLLENDYLVAEDIIARMKTQTNIVSLSGAYETETIAGLVSYTNLTIGMRLHSLIFSAKEAIPLLGLAYDPKVGNFLNSLELSYLALDIGSLKSDELFDRIKKTWKHQDEIREHLAVISNTRKKMVQKNASLALSLLEGENRRVKISEEIGALRELAIQQIYTLAEKDKAIAEKDKAIAEKDKAIAEKDKAIAEKDKAIAEKDSQIQSLNAELYEISISKTWRLALLLRQVRLFLLPPGSKRTRMARKTFFLLTRPLKYVYEKIPFNIRRKLPHLFQRIMGILINFSPAREIGMPGDITWDEFQAQVLSNRDQYKGIFIQEAIIDWHVTLYQRPQHLATALGKLGYLVIYRTQNLFDDDVNGFRYIGGNVWLTNSEYVDVIENAVSTIYSTSYFSDTLASISKINKERILIYEYIDHIDDKIIRGEENSKNLLRLKDFAFGGGVDFVVASAHKLEAEAISAVGKDKVVYIPNGVDTEHYRSPIHLETSIPKELVSFKRKYSFIVGYFGAIAPWLWYDAINQLMSSRPDLGFVFIGPDYLQSLNRLSVPSNFLYLGPIDYNILPTYAQQFDICFIPFEPGEIAHTTSPLKLFEYFALEKPVVVTSFMNECIAFDEVFHGDSAESLSEAIDKALLVKDDTSYKARLAQLADQNSWIERAKKLEFLFDKLK